MNRIIANPSYLAWFSGCDPPTTTNDNIFSQKGEKYSVLVGFFSSTSRVHSVMQNLGISFQSLSVSADLAQLLHYALFFKAAELEGDTGGSNLAL